MSLSNPLNLALIPPLIYLIYRQFLPSAPKPTDPSAPLPNQYDADVYNWMPEKHPSSICYKKYTPLELARFDGKATTGENRILLAIIDVGRQGKIRPGLVRTVFDVTAGASFYGPDGVYGNFAGRDASRGMAKQSYDDDMLTPLDKPLDTLGDLTASELDNMQGWHEHFSRKYIICGELIDV